MSLFIASLNSGSNGNCYYIGNNHEAVLIDAGIARGETLRRMKRLGLGMDKVRAIFISHEHTDHIRGAEGIANKFQVPIYITPKTLHNSVIKRSLAAPFEAYQPITIGGLTVHPFPKFHDAADPHSFMVTGDGINIGVFTDIGKPCEHVVNHFKQCHAVFLEANYDENMLAEGRYPAVLKKRISGDEGHLSNKQALKLFTTHKSAFMSHVLLSHLSKENNTPEVALELFTKHAGATKVVVASRYEETAVYTINSKYKSGARKITAPAKSMQTSLF